MFFGSVILSITGAEIEVLDIGTEVPFAETGGEVTGGFEGLRERR